MPNRTANGRRRCRSYERVWDNRVVDANLEDAWLESLNALEAFDLRSICEGHPRGTEAKGGLHPHIHLRRKASLPSITIREFDCRSEEIRMHLLELFGNGHSDFNVEFDITVRSSGITKCELWIKIRALHKRISESMNEETWEWFNSVIERIRLLDSLLLRLFSTC